MRYFLVAGETSGDMHAASLMKGLLAVDPEAEFSYFGGDAMAAVAPGMVMHCRDLAIMGFWEVLMGLRKILRNLKTCLRAIEDFQPDVVILVDFPGFNFRVAKACKERGLPVYYYIAPKVWAWKERRVERIRAYVDRLFIIFPFEVEYFRGKGIEAIYEGNPLLDELNISPLAAGESEEFFALHALDDRPKVALLPGSRVQEIRATLQRMGDLSVDYPDYQFVIAAAPSISVDEYAQVLDEFPDLAIVHGDTPGLMRHSVAGVITSGTATLEAALLGLPEVVVYQANPISAAVARRLVKLQWVSLVNLVLNRECVRELLQEDFNEANLRRELERILPGGDRREGMLGEFCELAELLGGPGASQRLAERMYALAQEE